MNDFWKRAIDQQGMTILVALSGGADSICALHLLKQYTAGREIKLVAGHVNHALRGTESDSDQEFAATLCRQWNIPFLARHVLPGYNTDEAALRQLRLPLLRSMAAEVGASTIALGHHRDDLAETFLLMALRGSGPLGLGSMREVSHWPGGFTVIRPLIGWSRQEIQDHLRHHGIDWREDSSNSSSRYRRNVLRDQVIPLLESLEPAAREMLATSARWCAAEHQDHADLMETLLRDPQLELVEFGGEVIALSRRALAAQQPQRIPGLLRACFNRLGVIGEAGNTLPRLPARARLLEATTHIIEGGRELARFDMGENLSATITSRHVLLHVGLDAEGALHKAREVFGVRFVWGNGRAVIPPTGLAPHGLVGGEQVDASPCDPPYVAEPGGASSASFMCSDSAPLWVAQAPADARIPIDSGGSKSVAACLKESGIPPMLRSKVLVVGRGEEILWIPGARIAPLHHRQLEGGSWVRVGFGA